MKKQILILFVAIMASTSVAWGQLSCPVPRTINPACLTSSALNPIPGTEYEYTVSVPQPPEGVTYNWFVTQSTQFITDGEITATIEPEDGSGDVLGGVNLVNTGSVYNNFIGGTATIYLTWKAFDPTAPVFVVIQVLNDDGCTTNNLKVYKIEPVNSFTLDIANVNSNNYYTPSVLGWGVDHESCVSDVVTSYWDATDEVVRNDYGNDTAYYLVNAANFTDQYTLSFELSGVNASEVISAEYAYVTAVTIPALAWTSLGAPTSGAGTTADPYVFSDATISAQSTNGVVGAEGECIIIRVIMDHTTAIATFNEGLALQPITLAVDALTGPDNDVPDVHHETGTYCGLPDGFVNDYSIHNLLPRPTITPVTPTPFETGTGL